MSGEEGDAQARMRRSIIAIQMDSSLSEDEKARRRQQLMLGGWASPAKNEGPNSAAQRTTGKLARANGSPLLAEIPKG